MRKPMVFKSTLGDWVAYLPYPYWAESCASWEEAIAAAMKYWRYARPRDFTW